MFVAEALISNEWTSLEDLITTVEAKTPYTIFNVSKDSIYAIEAPTTPDQGVVGIEMLPSMYLCYVKGNQNIYFRNDAKPDASGEVKPSRLTIHKKG